MLNNLFTGIFDAAGTAVISVPDFLLCIVGVTADRGIHHMGLHL